MTLRFSDDGKVAHLTNGSVSYVIEVVLGRYLAHRYFGPAIRHWDGTGVVPPRKRGFALELIGGTVGEYCDDFPAECPVPDVGDYRLPQLVVRGSKLGVTHCEPAFESWEELPEKPELCGLPSTRAAAGEATTLHVTLLDAELGVRVHLLYTLFDGQDVMARSMRVENCGTQELEVLDAQSLSLELPAKGYDVLTLYGRHECEANISRVPIRHGIQTSESTEGLSSPQHHPFMALLDPDATVDAGEVVAVHLFYSGSHVERCEQDEYGNVRLQAGINPRTFSWRLAPGSSFQTPEAILCHSDEGLSGMAQAFHWLYREHLMPARWAHRQRPVLFNSWEAMYYDTTYDKIEAQAKLAASMGAELYALDDGWFRWDASSNTAMGDWTCNPRKFPGGIDSVEQLVHGLGMRFGLWFEPEVISRRSHLFERHPDWALQVPGYEARVGRHTYLLDMGRPDVQDYLIETLDCWLAGHAIDYVKWDMNRTMSDSFSAMLPPERQGELQHRHILGTYRVLREVTRRHPDVLFEGCSSGGGRFDPGILAYVGQNWTSDNTDAADRTRIQWGYGLLYPPVAMGAHVSIVPNHQTGRTISLDTRFQVARQLNLGYELDVTKLTDEERDEIADQIAAYKADRAWMAEADLRLLATPNDNYVMWESVAPDRSRAMVMVFQRERSVLDAQGRFQLRGLDEASDYRIEETGQVAGGDTLARVGICVPLMQDDYEAVTYHLLRV